ncbi:SWI/SNF and RSC complexes subunit ssr4 [Madurella mycetomatis]|uniref:SWI/SNF and RSC complexes subunit ssr4 n=1 Tax=Madurella mycetomatis TaxID=100816 RepID=A0A175W9H5_9PEZI|nr:SWI/SNF and RSC complexes subunit ssr4 [Madurella mycetomatis]
MAGDPSQNVNGDLLPHVHLLSTFRYASMPRVDLGDVTKWLLQAPKIARDTAPFYWTYLDCPSDGAIFLTWQPTARRGNEFASDGYVWAGPEVSFQHNAGNGLTLEIYFQRAGYRIGEQFAVHSRRRFRLCPPQMSVANLPHVDSNLWIVHYGPAEKTDRLPVNAIGIPPPMQQMLNFRQHLFQMGQIVRKDFMLSDRVNWPQIPFPQRGQSMYAPPMPQRHVPQAMAYPPHPGPAVGPTPKRRAGHGPAGNQPQMMGAGFASAEGAFDDEEDISRGDMFDHLSPREISMARYQQNHEWMEEILSSPYRIGQIEAVDLGLGRKGELAALTGGIFEAQGGDALAAGPKKPYTGQLDPGLAEQFRKRVQERNETVRVEIEQMKAQHAKRLAKFKGNAAIKDAEQALRATTQDTGPEFWRLEGRLEDGEEPGNQWNQKQNKSLEEIVASVEEIVGKRAVVVRDVHRVQDGGYQEPAPEPEVVQPPLQVPRDPTDAGLTVPMSRQPSHAGSHASGVMIGDSDIDMGGTAAGLLDQMHTGFSSTSTPVNSFPTPQPQLSAIPSNAATPANLNVPSPHPTQAPTSQPSGPTQGDVNMEDREATRDTTTAPDHGTGSGDWVVVPKADVPPNNNNNSSSTTQPVNQTITTTAPTQQPQHMSSKPVSAAGTPSLNFDGDNNDFSSLGDLDTAGDALASYDPPSGDEGGLGVDDDLNMDMVEDSAFGDAFHGVEQHGHGQGSTPAAD